MVNPMTSNFAQPNRLVQILQGKYFAARSLIEFIRYFENWAAIWTAYRRGKSLPTLMLRNRSTPLTLHHSSTDDPIFLFREIVRERCYTLAHFYQPSNQDTVIDLGANIGVFMLHLVQQAPGIQVHCFEPSSRSRAQLQTQVNVNHLHETISIYPYAVSDRIGIATLACTNSSKDQSLFASTSDGSLVEQVNTLSLQEAIELCGVKQIDLLKMDVEGAEIEIVEGASAALWQKVRRVVCEYHDRFRPGCCDRVSACLRSHGFRVEIQAAPPDGTVGLIYATRES